ncbi:MAG: hypothetical protein IKG55_02980 [Solobacterium sp.]|nr:hypothetical protein [Solobacterium sp.]
MKDQWEECQELVEHVFGEKPETPLELVQIMIAMSDLVLEARGERSSASKKEAEAMS